MNQQSFEARVLHLWMTTRVPLTRANLQFCTHAPRKKMERWLDALVGDGVLDVDSDDDGEMVWGVRGAVRSQSGPTTVEELDRFERLGAEVGHARSALALASRASGLTMSRFGGSLAPREGSGDKSVVASAALSFFFGPVGWLYAAPLREAVPAIVLYALLWKLPLINILMLMLILPIHVVSGLAGAAYAWKHNQRGARTSLGASISDARRLPSKR